jgi:hypothetical protein
VYAGGRFVAVEQGNAVFALPNAAHVEHADPLVIEVAEAISGHFGAPISLRLVTETDLGSPYADADADATATDATATATATSSPSPESVPVAEASRPSSSERAATARQAARDAFAGIVDAPPPDAGTGPAEALEPETENLDLDDLEPDSDGGRHDSRMWAESRLLEEFPGAEEVT